MASLSVAEGNRTRTMRRPSRVTVRVPLSTWVFQVASMTPNTGAALSGVAMLTAACTSRRWPSHESTWGR